MIKKEHFVGNYKISLFSIFQSTIDSFYVVSK